MPKEKKSFPTNLLGDIVISVESARREAQESQCSLEERIGQLLVHGFLHLRGYEHALKKDETLMRKKGKQLWNKIGGQ
jgi:probable rRNA maturation factor